MWWTIIMFWPKKCSRDERTVPVTLVVITLKNQGRNTMLFWWVSDLGEISITEVFEVDNLINKLTFLVILRLQCSSFYNRWHINRLCILLAKKMTRTVNHSQLTENSKFFWLKFPQISKSFPRIYSAHHWELPVFVCTF